MLDRIVFCAAGGGPRVVATSLNPDEVRAWAGQLAGHAAVAEAGGPAVSMWYSSDGGAAALLYRLRGDGGTDDGGRGDARCHALVGWHPDLPPTLALRMHAWDGWTGPDWTGPQLQRLDITGWTGRHAHPGDLDAAAARQQASLAAVVAAVLRQSRRPVSIVSDRGDLAERAALLWGLHAIVGELLDVPGEPPFTFSTFEARHDLDGYHLPQVTFVSPDAAGHPSFVTRRRMVRLPAAVGGHDDAYSFAAKALVRCYVAGGVPAVQEWLDRRRVLATLSVVERLHRVVEAVELADTAAPPALVPAPPVVAVPPVGPVHPVDAVQPGGRDLNELGDVELVALVGCGDADTVRRAMHVVSGRRTPSLPRRRAEVRDLLVRSEFFEQRLGAMLAQPEVRRVVSDLARFAFTPADLKDDRAVHQVRALVARLETSQTVVDSLVALAIEYGEHAALLEAAGVRWMRERGHQVPATPAATAGRPPGGLHEPRSERYRRLLRAGRH